MLKTFIKGLVFGTGFTVAMITMSLLFGIGMTQWKIGETIYSESRYPEAEPELSNPQKAEIQPKRENASNDSPAYSFFNRPEGYGSIPKGGGILGMSVLPTPPDATRPRTHQIWLTETAMWKIRTDETTVEVEKADFPDLKGRSPDSSVFQLLSGSAERSATTISAATIEKLRRGEECPDDDHINGEFRITTDGVVFMMPDEIKR